MKLTHEDRKALLAWCLKEGLSIEYGRLSLCDLRNFRHSAIYDQRRYQVHSDDGRYPWSGLYDEIEPAIEKFLELKRKVRRMK